jgi:hypothetical protein
MGSVEQSTSGGVGDLNPTPRGGGRGGRRGGGRGGGGDVARGRSRGNARQGDQYEKRGNNRNNGQHNYNESHRNKDRPTNTPSTDVYQSNPAPELEFDEEQLALQEQFHILKVCDILLLNL